MVQLKHKNGYTRLFYDFFFHPEDNMTYGLTYNEKNQKWEWYNIDKYYIPIKEEPKEGEIKW